MKNTFFKLCMLFAALALMAGCIKPGRNPLTGWTELGSAYVVGSPFGPIITEDYRSYIQGLPDRERIQVDAFTIRFYKNTADQRAVKISSVLPGFLTDIRWEHVLIYDATGKRIKTVKYKSGRSLS